MFSIHFSLKTIQFFSNGPKSLPKSPPDCPILYNRVFDNFLLADESIAKALQSLETCVLVNNNLSGKLFSSLESPTPFSKTTSKLLQYHFLFLILIE